MEVLKSIIKHSNYRPTKGLKGTLYRLVTDKDLNREEIKAYFENKGKSNQFRGIYKDLKESLLDNILSGPLSSSYSNRFKNRFRVLKKQLQCKFLLQTDSKIAGIKLAIDTIPIAEKNNEFEVVHGLCRELVNQFSISNPDNQKFKKYFDKMVQMEKLIREEYEAEKIYNNLWYHYNAKKSIQHFGLQLENLEKIATDNNNYKFRYFYYSSKALYYQLNNENDLFIKNNKEAFLFFQDLDQELHYSIPFNFLSAVIPYYIANSSHAQAAIYLKRCLEMPPEGSFNWHRILIYRSAMGFYSKKPSIALQSFKMAQSQTKKFDSKQIEEQWHLIEGYLAVYSKLGEIPFSNTKFRLQKWLKVNEETSSLNQKANMLIVELLYYLSEKKHSSYTAKSKDIESNIQQFFNGHDQKRTRFFLKLLNSVASGNFHPNLVQLHAEKDYKKLISFTDIDSDTIEREIVPYEILWEMVLKMIAK